MLRKTSDIKENKIPDFEKEIVLESDNSHNRFLEERSHANLDNISGPYYDDIFHLNRGVQSKWHHLKFARFNKEIPVNSIHLDVGCGPGTFIGTLKNKCFSTGVDILPEFLNIAKARYKTERNNFLQISKKAPKLNFEDNTFDVITCIEVIEHIEKNEGEELLQEMWRVLRPGGRLLLSTPNYNSAWPLIELLVNHLGKISYKHQHIVKFNRNSLCKTLESLGSAHIRINSYMFLAPFIAFLDWSASDWVQKLEPSWLVSRFGLLLFAECVKPQTD